MVGEEFHWGQTAMYTRLIILGDLCLDLGAWLAGRKQPCPYLRVLPMIHLSPPGRHRHHPHLRLLSRPDLPGFSYHATPLASLPAPHAAAAPVMPAISAASLPHGRQLTFLDRFNIYRKAFAEPSFFVPPFLGAAYELWRNNPPEWGQGMQGYDRRLASGYARDVIEHTLKAGFAAADHEDPRHHLSKMHGVWPRARYAFIYTLFPPSMGAATLSPLLQWWEAMAPHLYPIPGTPHPMPQTDMPWHAAARPWQCVS